MFVVVIIIIVVVIVPVIIIELMTTNNSNNSSSKPAPNVFYNRTVQAYYLTYYRGTFPLVYFKLMSVLRMLAKCSDVCIYICICYFCVIGQFAITLMLF